MRVPVGPGASVHFPPDAVRLSPFELSGWFASERIDISFLPTPLAESYVQYGTDPRQLRCLLTGGDRLRVTGPHELSRFVNHYGPTEATVVTTYGEVSATASPGAAPIGRPIPSARVLLFDPETGHVVGAGPGELLIGGACLARGYWADEGLTGRRFTTVEGRPGRWYRTGDLARLDRDGCLWFEGRIDRQLKIRSVRVEPAEIESALLSHPAVADVAVEVGPAGELAAIVSRHPAGPEPAFEAVLMAHARTILPDTMLPQRVVVLAGGLPLSTNGKVDRTALRSILHSDDSAPGGAGRTW